MKERKERRNSLYLGDLRKDRPSGRDIVTIFDDNTLPNEREQRDNKKLFRTIGLLGSTAHLINSLKPWRQKEKVPQNVTDDSWFLIAALCGETIQKNDIYAMC